MQLMHGGVLVFRLRHGDVVLHPTQVRAGEAQCWTHDRRLQGAPTLSIHTSYCCLLQYTPSATISQDGQQHLTSNQTQLDLCVCDMVLLARMDSNT